MAGDAANLVLGEIIKKVVTLVVDGIGRQFGYLFCYKRNIDNLAKTAAQLENSRIDAENFFEEQRRNNEKSAQSSVGWRDEVKKVMKDAKQIEKDTDKPKGCLNLKGRYVQSRRSTKLAVKIQTLQNKAPKGIPANSVPPAGSLRGASANEASKGYKTRMQTLAEVMEALEDPAIRFIGLCGMGGVGKTTMVHEVRERARTQNLFDETAMSTVSQNIDLFKIQADLAEMLGLNALKEVKNPTARADQLFKRLTNGNKVLIILDDVWSGFKLEDVGIPVGSEHKKCKVLMTSRQDGVCRDIQKNIKVHALDKEEARALFRKTAGERVEKNNLGEIADEIADECEGLPIALLTLSSALSNDRRAWEDALRQLREGHFKGIKGMEQYVYQSIKLSYDFLAKEKLEEAQSLLQLCCQHEEDAEINLEKLARYCLALDLFKGVNGVVLARNKVCYLVGHLKSCFLLQAVDDGDKDRERVKVHDVVRDVCRFIASEVKEERDRVCMHIWNKEIDAGIGGTDLDYQKLKLLVEVPFHLTDHLPGIKSFLEQTQELRVFESAQRIWGRDRMDEQSAELSLAPQFSTSLRMLSLEHTNVYPGVMSEFVSLTGLEVLSFMGSTLLSFPHQVGQLSNLKLLDLRYKYSSETSMMPMPSGILPKLKKLEVLFMGIHYFPEAPYSDGEGEGDIEKESCPGSIEELDSLTNLTTLQVDLLDPTQLLDLKCFPFDNLKGFSFGSAGNWSSSLNYENRYALHMKNICLKEVRMNWILGDKIQSIVKSTVDLSLHIEDLTDTWILKKFASLKKLELTGCHQLEHIIHDGSSAAFVNLETLKIKEMRKVRELCHNGHLPAGLLHLEIVDLPEMTHLWMDHTDPLCLVNLKVVKIEECGALKFIFPHPAAKCLSQLQKLTVSGCGMLEGIFSKGEEGNSTGKGGEITQESNDLLIHFPNLTEVTITGSPNLRGFLNPDDGRGQSIINQKVMLPSIQYLNVWDINSIKAVFDFEGLEAMTMREDERSLLCKLQVITLWKLPKLEHLRRQVPKDVVIFQNLGRLDVRDCHSLAYLIPSSIARMLVNLRELTVQKCKGMKEVISKMNEEEDCGELEKNIVFPSLTEVTLVNLENLLSFCSSDQQVFEFPSLEILEIINCPEIETFCCQIPRVAPSRMLEENVNKGEASTAAAAGGEIYIYCNQAEIKMDPSDLAALFPKLKRVAIHNTPNFRGFYNIERYQVLVNLAVRASCQLKQMVGEGRDNLVSVAASSSLNLVQNLKYIILEKCEATRAVLDFEGFEITREDAHSVFNRLERIWLRQFSNLEHICRLLPKEINGFQNLRSLHVYRCDSLSYLLTSTMAHMLFNLKFLVIWKCKSMKEVMKMNEDCGASKIVFRSLCRVLFFSSEKLSSFCSSELQEFDFPSLNQVYIHKCPAMTNFCCGHLTAEKLQGVYFKDGFDEESDSNSDNYDVYDYGYDCDNQGLFDNIDGNFFRKGDANEIIQHFYARVNQIKTKLKEDGVDEDDEVAGDKTLSKDDLNENARHLNASVSQISCHVREDDVGDKDADDEDDIHVPEEGVNNYQCSNEERYEAISRDEAVSEGIIEDKLLGSGERSDALLDLPSACMRRSSGNFSVAQLADGAKDEIIENLTQRLNAQQMEMQQLQGQTQHELSQMQRQLSQVLALLQHQGGNVGSPPDSSLVPVPVIVSPSHPLMSNDDDELSHVIDFVPSVSTPLSVPSSDTPVQHFNARDDNQISNLKEDGIDNSAAAEDVDIDENAQCNYEICSGSRANSVIHFGTEERNEAIARDVAVLEGNIELGSSSVHIPVRPQAWKVAVSEGKQPNGDKVLGLGDISVAPLTDRAKDEIIKISPQRLDTQQMEMQQLEEHTQHQLSPTQHQLSQTQHQLSQTQHQLSIAGLVDRGKDEVIKILTQQMEMLQSQLSQTQHQLSQALSLLQQQMRQYQSGNTS